MPCVRMHTSSKPSQGVLSPLGWFLQATEAQLVYDHVAVATAARADEMNLPLMCVGHQLMGAERRVLGTNDICELVVHARALLKTSPPRRRRNREARSATEPACRHVEGPRMRSRRRRRRKPPSTLDPFS